MNIKKKYFIFFLFFIFSLSLKANNNKGFPYIFHAKVIGIKDGDTIEILYENTPYVIRLAHIDCPEKKQDFGMAAKKYISDMIFGKSINIESNGEFDRNHRLIATLFYENKNINKELVKAGLAWHFKKYSKDESYAILENEAHKKALGLWSRSDAVAPWIWRKSKKNN